MKFYKAQSSEIGEGVEATVLYHKDNGDELVCVRSGFEIFGEQNPNVEELAREDVDKELSQNTIKITVPVRHEIRKSKMSDEAIRAEIENSETPTVDIAKTEDKDTEGKEIQKLTFFEELEISSVDSFLEAQKAQVKELEPIIVEDEMQEKAEKESEIIH
jgi:hypothetical protein